MVRSIILASLLSFGGMALSWFHVGYTRAGEKYITKHREKRKSIRPGYYYGGYHHGFRGGK